MKTKNTPWTAQEDAALAQAVKDRISPARLSVRLNRSEGSIKRRMRELGLTGKRHARQTAERSVEVDPTALVSLWLAAGRSGDLVSLMRLYEPDATLECACTGPAVFAGLEAIQEYWAPRLRSKHPLKFSLSSLQVANGRVVVDYLSYEAKPVRMVLAFDQAGRIVHSECGPGGYAKRAA